MEFLCLLKRPQFTRRKKKISFALSPFLELESYQTTSPIFSFPLSDPQTTTFTCWSWYQFSSFFFMMQSPFLPNSSKLDQAASHVNSCVALIILTCMWWNIWLKATNSGNICLVYFWAIMSRHLMSQAS